MLARLRAPATAALHVLFPPRCLACGTEVASDFGLCADCWRETGFITGLACTQCGTPLPGQDESAVLCDECLSTTRPWSQGRAAFTYAGAGRRMVMAFKHGDRLDLAPALGGWLARAGAPLIEPGMVVAPIPLHRQRLIRRRYNQSALLSRIVAKQAGLTHVVDLFHRLRATPSQEGRDRAERFANLEAAIAVSPRRRKAIEGRPVLIIDDVMTSGATFAAATEAALAAGASCVNVLALARVAKNT